MLGCPIRRPGFPIAFQLNKAADTEIRGSTAHPKDLPMDSGRGRLCGRVKLEHSGLCTRGADY
jgi:hypothetical protein